MVKQGGTSYHGGKHKGKAGISGTFRCSICGKSYKTSWPHRRHEVLCKQYTEANK